MTQLTNRTFAVLRIFAQAGEDFYMPTEHAQRIDQRPFRALGQHDWIRHHPGKGFFLTQRGRAAWEEFRGTKVNRKNPRAPITSYFDLSTYGLGHRARGAA